MRTFARILAVGVLAAVAAVGGYLALLGPGADTVSGHDASVARGWSAILDEVPLEAFARVGSGPLDFPRDHGAHPNSPIETWNLSAHLRGEDAGDVGFQFFLIRLALADPEAEPANSAWEMREFYRGHAIFVSAGGVANAEERLRRGVPGIAGYDAAAREWRLDNWSMRVMDGPPGPSLIITATIGDTLAVELHLAPEKTAIAMPAPNAAEAPFRGYSMTRLSATGTLLTAEGREALVGAAWLDHLWGDLPLPTGPTASDRLLLQGDDGTDISLIRTRRRDGRGTPTVDGFVVGRNGNVSTIEGARMEPTQRWRPGRSSSDHPVGWRLILDVNKELVVSPLIEDQLYDFVVPVWSGIVTARGELGAGPVNAVGTLQLNGYSTP